MDIRLVIPGMAIATPDPFAVGLGGCETAGLQLGRAFARKGHQVTVFCNTTQVTRWQSVRLVPMMGYTQTPAARAGDLLLIQRDTQLLTLPHTAKAAFLWVHDQPCPRTAQGLMAALPAVDRVVTVSAWQAQRFRALAHDLPEEQILISRNGIDLDLVATGVREAGGRDPYRIVYTSQPERGLEVLLGDVFPRILAAEPRATLHLAYYDCPNPEVERYGRHLRTLAERFGERVIQHGALAKRELYWLMATSGVYLYPTPAPACPEFAETSCITAMEAMACGLPWVSSDAGALPETVGDAGVLVPLDGAPHAAAGDMPARLAAAALAVMGDETVAARLRLAGLERAARLGWSGVADQLSAAADQLVSAAPSKLRPVRSLKPAAEPERLAVQAPPHAPPANAPRPTLIIATPVYDAVHPRFVNSLLATHALLPRHGIEVQWASLAGVSLIPHARNQLAATCLSARNVSHILWVDADISWQPEAVLRLLQSDVDIACGLYPAKREPVDPPAARLVFMPLLKDDGTVHFDASKNLLEIESAGTGFMMTKRVVYERIAQEHPESKITKARGLAEGHPAAMPFLYNYFPIIQHDGALLAEDMGFCHRWRQLGGQIWADPSIQLTHHGAHAYRCDPMSMFEAVQ